MYSMKIIKMNALKFEAVISMFNTFSYFIQKQYFMSVQILLVKLDNISNERHGKAK